MSLWMNTIDTGVSRVCFLPFTTFCAQLSRQVMRACEGCRRRKIKCDAATTNTWPCASCVRLKLSCLPPTLNFDGSDAINDSNQSSNDTYPVPIAHVNLGNFVNNNNNYQYNETPTGQPYYPPPPPNHLDDSYHHVITSAPVTAAQMRTQSIVPIGQGVDDFHYRTLKTSTAPVDGRYFGSLLRDPSTDPATTSPGFDDFQYSTLKDSTSPTVERYPRNVYSKPSSDRATVARTEKSRTPDHDGDLSQALQDLKISEAGLGQSLRLSQVIRGFN